MQANNIAQRYKANGLSTAGSLGYPKYSGQLMNSTFANMFAQIQASGQSSAYAGTQQTNAAASAQRTYDTRETEQSSRDYSKETDSYREASRTEDRQENQDPQVSTAEEGSGDPPSAVSNNAQTDRTEEASGGEEQEQVSAEFAAFMQNLSQLVNEGTLDLSGLKEAARADLQRLLKAFQEGDTKAKGAVMAEVKALIKESPDFAKLLTEQSQKTGGDKGAQLSALKDMLTLLDLKPQSVAYKKGVKDSAADKEALKSDFSMLESAASEHSKRKLSKDAAKEETAGNSGQSTDQNEASQAKADRVMNAAAEGGARSTQAQDGSVFKRTLSGAEGKADVAAAVTRQSAQARGAGKAGAGADQASVIKNFQEVRALLDKQLVQVKEASPSTMTVKLNPDELGKISIQLELLEDGRLKGKIFAENEITRNSLLQHAEAMKDQIRAQGVTLESFEIDLGGEQTNPDFSGFEQQGQSGRQAAKNRQGSYADLYGEELSEQPGAAAQDSGMINTLA